jgi:hypothetical protein
MIYLYNEYYLFLKPLTVCSGADTVDLDTENKTGSDRSRNVSPFRSEKRNPGQLVITMGLLRNGTSRGARILGRDVDGGGAISF